MSCCDGPNGGSQRMFFIENDGYFFLNYTTLENLGMKYLIYADELIGWLVVLGLTTLSVYIGPSPREREKKERNDREKCSNNPHPL